MTDANHPPKPAANASNAKPGSVGVAGAPPVIPGGLPPRAPHGTEERDAVLALFDRAIESGVPIGYDGTQEEALCHELAALLGGGYADAVNSGTSALYVALRALDLPLLGEVIVGAITDPGGMMPIPLCGLVPVVTDTAAGSFNIDESTVADCLSDRTVAIVVPHIGGDPAPIDRIIELARPRGIAVIEDCAQAPGATLGGEPVGRLGDIAVFSTMFGKHVSTGGQGGMVFTRLETLFERIRNAADRGKPAGGQPTDDGNLIASLNLNLDEIHAAIGRTTLRRLARSVAQRGAFVDALAERVGDNEQVSVCRPSRTDVTSAYWFVRFRYHGATSTKKAALCAALVAEGVPVSDTYRAMPHTFRWFQERRVFGDSGWPWSDPRYTGNRTPVFPCPNARAAIAEHFHLAINEAWGAAEADLVAQAIAKVTEDPRWDD